MMGMGRGAGRGSGGLRGSAPCGGVGQAVPRPTVLLSPLRGHLSPSSFLGSFSLVSPEFLPPVMVRKNND